MNPSPLTSGSVAQPLVQVPVEKCTYDPADRRPAALDAVIVEEPFEIRLKLLNDAEAVPISITMRTPGDDLALTLGFLYGERVINGLHDLVDPESPYRQGNHWVEITLNRDDAAPASLKRNFYTSSSCGVCGKSSIAIVQASVRGLEGARSLCDADATIHHSDIAAWVGILESSLSLFQETGGNHGSCILNRAGKVLSAAEDVGRHNAFDKCIGRMILDQRPFSEAFVACFSGRISFELMQKAIRAGIPLVIGLGAPSSLAVSLAQELDVGLVGFAKGRTFNLYHAGKLRFAV